MGAKARVFGSIFTALLLTLLCCRYNFTAQVSDPRLKAVDALFAKWSKPDSPGCVLGIIQNGRFLYKQGFGSANLEYNLPITPKSVFRIGSTSKQFTAMCIVLLAEEGNLVLENSIRDYIPDMPDYADEITVKHLLHHTSGIRDYLTLWSIAGARDGDFFTDPEVVAMLTRQKELNFKPGDEFLYSNSGYFLLAEIVRRITGKSMRYYAAEKIFKPLGMKNTHFHDDSTEIVPNRASGYAAERGGGFTISMTTLGMIGDGGVFTTAEDLLLWDQNFYHNKLGKGDPALIAKMLTTGILNSGKQLDYAFGLGVTKYRGLDLVSHGGAFVGFRADMLRFPEQKFSVICLANLSQFNPSQMARKVADIFLVDHFQETVPVQKPRPAARKRAVEHWEPETDALLVYLGKYFSEELQVAYWIDLKQGKLYLRHENPYKDYPRAALVPETADTFKCSAFRLNFIRNGQCGITAFTADAGRVKNIRFKKTD